MLLHWHRCMCTTNNNTPSKPVQHQAPGSREVEEGGVCNRGDLCLWLVNSYLLAELLPRCWLLGAIALYFVSDTGDVHDAEM